MANESTPGSSSPLLKVLETRLKSLPCTCIIRGYHLLVSSEDSYHRIRFIFLSQLQDDDREIFVVGLKSHEYLEDHELLPNRRLVHLQYIDTTGFFRPRPLQSLLTRCLIGAYIEYLASLQYFHRIYIVARSQPEYLFRLSERNPLKKALSDSALIEWWARTLTVCENISTGFWILPCIDPSLSPLHRRLTMRFDMCSAWKEGYPYSNSNSAIASLPKLEDDPITSHLTENTDKKMTIRELFETLSLRDEFANRYTALFFLNLNHDIINRRESNESCLFLENPLEIETFQTSFHSLTHAALATQTKILELHRRGCDFLTTKIDHVPLSKNEKGSTDFPPISNIQNLVKKKSNNEQERYAKKTRS